MNTKPSDYLTPQEAADQVGVSTETVLRWHDEGHFPLFVPPGKSHRDHTRGPKGYRIPRADWERFLASRTYKVSAPAAVPVGAPVAAVVSRAGLAVGPDGKRRKRK